MLNYTNGIELLSKLHIKNRGLRLDMFTPVTPTNKPSVPDRQYVYEGVPDIVDGVAMQKWVIADKPLAQYQDEKKQEMKQARKAATESTTTVTINAVDYEVDCDAPARSAIHQTIDNSTLAGLTDADVVNWKLATGTYQQFTLADLKSIAVQMAVHIQTQYEKEAVLIAQIDAATIDTLDTLTWV